MLTPDTKIILADERGAPIVKELADFPSLWREIVATQRQLEWYQRNYGHAEMAERYA